MSPTLRPPGEAGLKRTAMSTRELRRAEVLGRVKSRTLRLVDAAKMLEVSYRQAKRLWLAALSGRRSQRAAASQRRPKFESGEAREIPAEGAAADPGEVFGNGTRTVWTYAGSRTFGGRGWGQGGRGDVATLDAGGGVVEPQAETEGAPEAAGAEAALW